jgi:Zn-dependent peptidase ImmA (M78 family)
MPDIAKKVEELLGQFRFRHPPVRVEQIPKKVGILLIALPTEDEISGALIREADRTVIAVNPTHHPNRQRFTIAHELGHYFLHKNVGRHVDADFTVAWRKKNSSAGVDWSEIEANRFAAELLIPTKFLKEDIDSLEHIDLRTVALLADRYEVSKDAMKFRLTNLGILGLKSV